MSKTGRSLSRDIRHMQQQHYQHAPAPYLLPWAGAFLLCPFVGLAMYLLCYSSPWKPAAAIGVALAGGFVIYVGNQAARPRGKLRRDVTTAYATTLVGWLCVAPFVDGGPFHFDRPWLFLLLLLGLSGSLSVNTLRWLRGSDDDPGATDFGDFAERVRNLKIARMTQVRTAGGKISAEIELHPGTTVKELQDQTGTVASLLDAPASGVRFIPNPDSNRRGRLEIVPYDELRLTVPWPGPSHPGQSITKPIVIGRYEDGRPMLFWLPGDPGKRNATHVLIMGMTGAGKTEGVLTLAGEVITRCDAELDFIDTVKKAQTYGPIEDGVTTLINTKADARRYLRDLRDRVLPERTEHLGRLGHTEWVEGCGIPYKVVIIEEAPAVILDNEDEIVELLERSRSAGVCLVLALQRASYDRLPTSARSNIGAVLCFGVRAERDATFALSEPTIDAGATPHHWANRKPGYSYLEAPGVDEEEWSTPGRTYRLDRPQLVAVVRAYAPTRAIAANNGGGAAPPAPAAAPPPPPELDDELKIERPEENPDPDQPITIPDREPIRFGDPEDQPDRKKTTQAEARSILLTKLQDLRDAQVPYVRSTDLADIMVAAQRGRTWVVGELRRLCQEDSPDRMLRVPVEGEAGCYRFLEESRV